MLLQPPQPRREPEPDGTKRALRAATLGIVALLLFGVLVFRLWALQVLRSAEYVAQANVQNTREIPIPPQRGDIVDRNGVTLVENTSAVVLQVDPSTNSRSIDCSTMGDQAATSSTLMAAIPVGAVPRCRQLPQQPRCFELSRLARVLKTPEREVWRTYERPLLNGDKGARYVINAGPPVALGSAKDAQVAFVLERRDHYPGVSFLRTYKRSYTPWPALGKILGYVGAITPDELKDPQFKDLPLNATVGQDGVEYTYDKILRGTPGELNQSFDASGHAIGQPYMVTPPQTGQQLKLTVDAKLQQAAIKAIYDGINIAHTDGEVSASKGAIVAMDPKTGGILALASVPSYRSNIYGSTKLYKEALRAGALNDEAINGLFAPGSTFKPFTAAAAWWKGFIGPGSTRECAGSFERPGDTSHTVFENWDTASSGTIDLSKALEISCDTFFYQLGNQFYDNYLHGQEMFPPLLRRFGFGQSVPLDIRAGTAAGLVPDPQWRERTYTNPIDQDWQPGYDITMAIGQSDLQVSPLQLATAYSALANGGALVTPHVAQSSTDVTTGQTTDIPFKPQRKLDLSPEFVTEVRNGLYQATHASDGTSTSVFGTFQPAVAGKTGTAEKALQDPYAWWAGWAPYDDPKIVVVALIENGGHGGVSAAPAAREVLQAYFHPNTQTTIVKGTDTSH